jgi:alkaline phosphatase D
MKVKPVTVGPILGHVSTDLARLFGRAEYTLDEDSPRRAHGVIRFKKTSARDFSKPQFFKMNPNFDMTGVAVLAKLSPSTAYEYQLGWLYSDVDSKDMNLSDELDWSAVDTFEFKTASADKNKSRNLVLGSCRYALRLFGGTWFDDRGDKTFKSILAGREDGDEVDQLIMCGDQIYADDLNIIGADCTLDEYNKRYRKVFTSKNLRKLMAQVPTYMILDDHEIEDNWPSSASKKDWVTKFPAAIHAYSTYQASHSPLFSVKNGHLEGAPSHLWYTYEDGCCEFFVCDTRTERFLEDGSREILGPRQLKALLKWLNDGSGQVKVIVSSVTPYESENTDTWHGFISQRDQILEHIRANSIQKVVFLSGDVHACMSSQLTLDDKTKVTSVVSSAFFWPYPHPNRRDFKLSGKIATDTPHSFTVKSASQVYATDAYVKLSIAKSGLKVDFVSRKGKRLGRKRYVL